MNYHHRWTQLYLIRPVTAQELSQVEYQWLVCTLTHEARNWYLSWSRQIFRNNIDFAKLFNALIGLLRILTTMWIVLRSKKALNYDVCLASLRRLWNIVPVANCPSLKLLCSCSYQNVTKLLWALCNHFEHSLNSTVKLKSLQKALEGILLPLPDWLMFQNVSRGYEKIWNLLTFTQALAAWARRSQSFTWRECLSGYTVELSFMITRSYINTTKPDCNQPFCLLFFALRSCSTSASSALTLRFSAGLDESFSSDHPIYATQLCKAARKRYGLLLVCHCRGH